MKSLSILTALAVIVACITNGQGKPTAVDDVIVKVAQGSLQGKKETSQKTGGEFYKFQGIPYAQPPVGNLRFKAPVQAPGWSGVRNATYHRSVCLQTVDSAVQGSEDCLYLNVYTPQLPSSSRRNLLPVMVWIHGGGFLDGSGNDDMAPPDYLVHKGVLLVTLNYRLGVIGFFGLNNSLVSQNNGLKDQMTALKWVQANIAQFGGDKDQVTIFGESAGGALVDLQVVSPATKGLFQRAITQSGSAVARWAYVEPSLAKQRAFRLGELLGFTSDNEEDLIAFLKAAPAHDLINFQRRAVTNEDDIRHNNLPFPSTKESGDNVFLPDSPLNIMKSGKYQHVPVITGFTSAEAKMFQIDYLHNDSLWTEVANNMEQFVPPELGLALGSPQSLHLASEIKNMYFGNDTPTVKNIEGLVNALSDAYFVSSALRSVKFRLRVSSSPVYLYQFSYVGRFSLSESYGYPFRGAGHADELGYIFSFINDTIEKNSTEMLTIQRMTTMWTNFAKTGNPGEGVIQWDTVKPSKKTYLDIDNELTVRKLDELHPARMALWDRIFEGIDGQS